MKVLVLICFVFYLQFAPFDPTKKKKKKKKEVVIQDPADDSVDKLGEKVDNLSGMNDQYTRDYI